MAAISGLILGSWRQMFDMGSTMYSAKAPGRFTPTPCVCAQRCRRPARQFRQRPQVTCPSPLTSSPGWKSETFAPTATISPDKFMSNDHGHRNRGLGPRVPLIYMEIGAANSGEQHADFDVVDANFRLGYIFQPEATGAFCFNQCFHLVIFPVTVSRNNELSVFTRALRQLY